MEETREAIPVEDLHTAAANESRPMAGHDNEILQDKQEAVQVEVADEIEKANHEAWYTQEEADRVIKKLDWHIMPLIFILYSLSVLDRLVWRN